MCCQVVRDPYHLLLSGGFISAPIYGAGSGLSRGICNSYMGTIQRSLDKCKRFVLTRLSLRTSFGDTAVVRAPAGVGPSEFYE